MPRGFHSLNIRNEYNGTGDRRDRTWRLGSEISRRGKEVSKYPCGWR